MVSIKIQSNDIGKYLKSIGPEMEKNLQKALVRNTLAVEADSVRQAPADTGTLRKSISSVINTGRAFVSPSFGANVLNYAKYVIFGTRPHTIYPRRGKAIPLKKVGGRVTFMKRGDSVAKNNKIFAKKVRHPGTKPNDFFERAVERTKLFVSRNWEAAINKTLRK